jgi:asparagine synthase (glutamine-hydrolysing)
MSMSQFAGLIDLDGEDITDKLVTMLTYSSPVKADSFGFSTYNNIEHSTRIPDFLSQTSDTAIGFKLVKIESQDSIQPLPVSHGTTAFIGRLWQNDKPQSLAFTDVFSEDFVTGMKRLLRSNGSYSVAIVEDHKILLSRDSLGVAPLYVGWCGNLLGFASNIRMLKSVGLDAISVQPGSIMELSNTGLNTLYNNPLTTSNINPRDMQEAVDQLHVLLSASVAIRSRGLQNPTVAFSGGIDSTMIAALLTEIDIKPHLICVGLEGSGDFEAAESSASALDLNVDIHAFTASDLEEEIPHLLQSVEDPDPMKIAVAAPLHWVATRAKSNVVFSGNGSDELLGGYAKYVRFYSSSPEKAKEAIRFDVFNSYAVNYERDWKTCADVGVELRLPFADAPLTDWGLSLPLEYKLSPIPEGPRKLVLRALANKIGLPSIVVDRPKKAAQFSSGTAKAIKRFAKKMDQTPQIYLKKRLEEALRDDKR